MIFGLFGPREKRPRRLKMHDIEVNFDGAAGKIGYAKLDQNIYSDDGGMFQLIVRDWRTTPADLPLELWIAGRKVAEWPMSGRDFKLRHDAPRPQGVPKIEIGSEIELRRGLVNCSGIAEAD